MAPSGDVAATLLRSMREGFAELGYTHRTLFGGAAADPPLDMSSPEDVRERLDAIYALGAQGVAVFTTFVGWALSETERARLLAVRAFDLDSWPEPDTQRSSLAQTLRVHGNPHAARHQGALLWALSAHTAPVAAERMRAMPDPAMAFSVLQQLPAHPAPELVDAALAACL